MILLIFQQTTWTRDLRMLQKKRPPAGTGTKICFPSIWAFLTLRPAHLHALRLVSASLLQEIGAPNEDWRWPLELQTG